MARQGQWARASLQLLFGARSCRAALLLALVASRPALAAHSAFHSSRATGPAVSALVAGFETYDTREQAQIAALRGIVQKKVECGGAVLFNPTTKRFAYTATVGQGEAAHFQAAVLVPRGWQLDSVYHTHPQGAQSSRFSQEDITLARRLAVPSYVLSRYDNTIRSFDPGTSAITKSASGESSPGEVVVEAPPSDTPGDRWSFRGADAALARAAPQRQAGAARQLPLAGKRAASAFPESAALSP